MTDRVSFLAHWVFLCLGVSPAGTKLHGSTPQHSAVHSCSTRMKKMACNASLQLTPVQSRAVRSSDMHIAVQYTVQYSMEMVADEQYRLQT
jgi:hypothetical protein